MQLYKLGKVPWQESQLIYHALAKLGREALCLVSPSAPYVCIGFHQDVAQEVDLDFCQANNIPVFRREVGGGAVSFGSDAHSAGQVGHGFAEAAAVAEAAGFRPQPDPRDFWRR